ncbi:class I adenylate-forming enzyme family protein [Alloalcanivorax mobilis]|uniref:class I adenylate-forming enzyme family protein n=1 Tax=Alloalcanivorax mobilis TaxID=2019569 RepID=UPI000C78BB99|nr:class I adenylate-forming enzyme family protein [Alloalcanivorax mobilis]
MSGRDHFATRYEQHFGDRLVRCFAHRPGSVLDSFRRALGRAPQNDCIVADGGRYSYRQAADAAERIAAQLAQRGVEAGDRVALLLGNDAPFVLSLLAIARLGAIAVPVNVREQRDGIGYILGHCEARAVICDADQIAKIAGPEQLPALAHRFIVGGDAGDGEPFQALLADPGKAAPEPALNEEDTAIILYTSGTTGRPKGVMLTHLNLIHTLMHYQQRMSLVDGERSLLVVPASHVTGVAAVILTMMHVAGCVVLVRQFDAAAFVALAARERITHTSMVPAMYNLCLLRADFSEHDLSAWRIGGFGGAPMPEVTIARLHEQLPALQLINAYGATETTSPTTVLPPGDAAHCPDSVGTVVTCGEVRVMDDQGREVPAGEAGELWISGPMVVPGYWNNAEANQREFVAGHWRSGDIGSKDQHGYVRVHDRKKDMINRGGYNIYSVELENLIVRHPGVVECAAVAQPDPVLGEKIHIFISHGEQSPAVQDDAIKRFCAEHLADYKIPDYITLQSEPLPRNANGKVIKAQLRQRLSAG